VYIGAGCEAVFNLNCPNGRVELRESFGFSTRELNQVAEQLKTEQGFYALLGGRFTMITDADVRAAEMRMQATLDTNSSRHCRTLRPS
jgi:hypothetical protein